jgi:hypothetical protein
MMFDWWLMFNVVLFLIWVMGIDERGSAMMNVCDNAIQSSFEPM